MAEIPIPGQPSPDSKETGLIVHPTLGRQSAQFQQVVRYVEALKDGKGPRQAAKAAGTTIPVLRLQGRAIGKYLAKARQEYAATAEEIREIAILRWMESAMQNPMLDDGTPNQSYDAREKMMALHELSLMPEVGLKGKAVGGARGELQFSEETQEVLDSIDIEDAT